MIRLGTAHALQQHRRSFGRGYEANEGAAGAVVLAAINGASSAILSRMLDDACGDDAVCRWVAETDTATILPGRCATRQGQWLAVRIEEQRGEWFASLSDALSWSLRGAAVAQPSQQTAQSTTSDAKPYRYTE